jgi:hypothetical protein
MAAATVSMRVRRRAAMMPGWDGEGNRRGRRDWEGRERGCVCVYVGAVYSRWWMVSMREKEKGEEEDGRGEAVRGLNSKGN